MFLLCAAPSGAAPGRFVAPSRLPALRRVSQIVFLLLFVGLLVFTSLRSTSGGTADIHLRAPVRLFFLLDPLVAITNALASHALYRGLFFASSFSCPHSSWAAFSAAGSAPWAPCSISSAICRPNQNAASSASNRIAINAGRLSNISCCIAGLVAALFGSMAIGWLDPFSLLVRSIGLSLLPAFNFALRAVITPLEHSPIAAADSRR